jgi:type IV pilus assembly protein PilA
MQKHPTHKNSSGFTLIEILIGIAIIGILSAVAIPQYNKYKIRGYDAHSKQALRDMHTLCNAYWLENNSSDGCELSLIKNITYGFNQNPEIVATLPPSPLDNFCASAKHNSSPNTYSIDSAAKIIDGGQCDGLIKTKPIPEPIPEPIPVVPVLIPPGLAPVVPPSLIFPAEKTKALEIRELTKNACDFDLKTSTFVPFEYTPRTGESSDTMLGDGDACGEIKQGKLASYFPEEPTTNVFGGGFNRTGCGERCGINICEKYKQLSNPIKGYCVNETPTGYNVCQPGSRLGTCSFFSKNPALSTPEHATIKRYVELTGVRIQRGNKPFLCVVTGDGVPEGNCYEGAQILGMKGTTFDCKKFANVYDCKGKKMITVEYSSYPQNASFKKRNAGGYWIYSHTQDDLTRREAGTNRWPAYTGKGGEYLPTQESRKNIFNYQKNLRYRSEGHVKCRTRECFSTYGSGISQPCENYKGDPVKCRY